MNSYPPSPEDASAETETVESLKARLSALVHTGEIMRLSAQAYWEDSAQDDGFSESMCAWDEALAQTEKAVLAHDQEMVRRTLALLSPVLEVGREPEDNSWFVSLPVMPGHVGGGASLGEAAEAAADAAQAWLEAALDRAGQEGSGR